jgi:hypothetical protein
LGADGGKASIFAFFTCGGSSPPVLSSVVDSASSGLSLSSLTPLPASLGSRGEGLGDAVSTVESSGAWILDMVPEWSSLFGESDAAESVSAASFTLGRLNGSPRLRLLERFAGNFGERRRPFGGSGLSTFPVIIAPPAGVEATALELLRRRVGLVINDGLAICDYIVSVPQVIVAAESIFSFCD